MRYYAFIIRHEDRRYRARLPDFPECSVWAESIAQVPAAVAAAIRSAAGASYPHDLPPQTPFAALPRMDDALDGCWLLVDVGPATADPLPQDPAG